MHPGETQPVRQSPDWVAETEGCMLGTGILCGSRATRGGSCRQPARRLAAGWTRSWSSLPVSPHPGQYTVQPHDHPSPAAGSETHSSTVSPASRTMSRHGWSTATVRPSAVLILPLCGRRPGSTSGLHGLPPAGPGCWREPSPMGWLSLRLPPSRCRRGSPHSDTPPPWARCRGPPTG